MEKKLKTKTVPQTPPGGFRQSLFWDVDPKTIDPEKNAVYVIERVLDFGTMEELRWMAHYYPKDLIQKVVQTSRVLQRKSRALWEPVFEVRYHGHTALPF